MKTSNGQTPNPRNIFGGGMKKETSNVVKSATGGPFSAKKDCYEHLSKKTSGSARKY